MHRSLVLAVALVVSSACSGPSAPSTSSTGNLSGRTYNVKVPANYDGKTPLPLVVAMHAYGSNGAYLEWYFGLDQLADQRGFFVVYPEGTVDSSGRQFFTATDACCDFFDTGVDDVAFIGALLDRIESTYAIDEARVFAVGHSNGAFMAHRLACDLSTRFAAIVSLEGATWNDQSRCRPTEPVAILEVHGTDDTTISPAGGNVVDGFPDRVYPPVARTMTTWATLDACDGTTTQGDDPGAIDSEESEPATPVVWNACRADVELWMIPGGKHAPQLTAQWPVAVVDFLMAHPKGGTPAQ